MKLVALVWGFAEATLFFVVPDVLLTDRGVTGIRAGLIAGLLAAAGAMVGGTLMYTWGHLDPESALVAVEKVPAVSVEMVEEVGYDLDSRGLVVLPVGAVTGRPYKLYAAQSGRLGIGLLPFLLATVPSRLFRFVAVVLLAAGFSRLMSRRWSEGRRRMAAALLIRKFGDTKTTPRTLSIAPGSVAAMATSVLPVEVDRISISSPGSPSSNTFSPAPASRSVPKPARRRASASVRSSQGLAPVSLLAT